MIYCIFLQFCEIQELSIEGENGGKMVINSIYAQLSDY
jgi:hypothetical protein